MIWHSSTKKDVVRELATDPENGLTSDKVNQRLEKYGPNEITALKRKGFFPLFAAQFKDFSIIVLLIAAVLSFITAFLTKSQTGVYNLLEPVVIVLIVVISALMGAFQQKRAESTIDTLRTLAPPSAAVIRNGEICSVPAVNLVPGDIIIVNPGDYIPADARLLTASSLWCDESSITGEDIPAEKKSDVTFSDITAAGNQANMIFAGCSVKSGSGRAVVTDTGMYTEMGKMASIIGGERSGTIPLTSKLHNLGRISAVIALCVCAFIFIFGMIFTGGHTIFERFLNMFMTSVSLAVAAIPEGLTTIVTVVLAAGVKRMVSRGAIVHTVSSIETLGNASVICTDKTGTLTKNCTAVSQIFDGREIIDLEETNSVSPAIANIIRMGAMCGDASVEIVAGKTVRHGDPTEAAIVAAAMRYADSDKITLDSIYPRLCALPFDSERRLMTTVNMIDGRPVAVVKGAPDVLIPRCPGINRELAEKMNNEMTSNALRVIAIAFKALETEPANPTSDELENNLHFAGLIGLFDPPREDAREAVSTCQKAGIRVIMMTGDHINTAVAVAKRLGILTHDSLAITGEEVEAMSDEKLCRSIDRYSVYARLSPTDKVRIIKAWQKKGEVVSMIGDGINDAPSINTADIGCTVESRGADVAKGAADIIFTKDSFATMVKAINEGRAIYANIRKAVNYLLSCNIAEVMTVFFAMLFWHSSPLIAVQLLWINMITSGFPALAIGVEKTTRDTMFIPPRSKDENLLNREGLIYIAVSGLIFMLCSLIAFSIGGAGTAEGSTMAFAVLAFSLLLNSLSMRNQRSFFNFKAHRFNPQFIFAFFIGLALIIAVLFVPALQGIFGLGYIAAGHWKTVVILSLIPFVLNELWKIVRHIFMKNK